MADFPTALSAAADNTTDVLAKHINNLETKVGINNSADTDSLDYLLKAQLQGALINGKLAVSVAANDLTVSLVGMDGNAPSATNPVFVIIDGIVRSVTAALTFTLADGANYFNAGVAAFATKVIDYTAYLGWNTAGGCVVLVISRVPFARVFSDFSLVSGVVETSMGYSSNYSNTAATDTVVCIGRLPAILSASANYYWSIPTLTASNLIQAPIRETSWLDYAPTVTMTNAPTSATTVAKYQIRGNGLHLRYQISGTANASAASTTVRITLPFSNKAQKSNTAIEGSGIWSDDATFVEGSNGIWWFSTSEIVISFATATRKPTLISLCAFYDI